MFEPRWGILSLCWRISRPHDDLQPCQELNWGAGYLLPCILAALTGQQPCTLIILPSASLTLCKISAENTHPHPLPHFSSGSYHVLAARVPHTMSSSVVTSSLGSKRLSPGSARLLARARVARQDDVQIIGPSGNFHTEGWHMAICIAPCSLSWLATYHSQRLGAQEAASHLMYFYPRFSILIPLGSPALEWTWGPPQPVGSRQQGVLLLSGSGSTPGLTMASKGQAVWHTSFLWKPSCTKTRGKPARRLCVSCPEFLGQPAGTHNFLQSCSSSAKR